MGRRTRGCDHRLFLPAHTAALGLLARAQLNDKVEHFAAYAFLAGLPAWERFGFRHRGAVAIPLFLFFWGAALEVGQLYSPGRSCDWHDLLANTCGIVSGLFLVRTFQKRM